MEPRRYLEKKERCLTSSAATDPAVLLLAASPPSPLVFFEAAALCGLGRVWRLSKARAQSCGSDGRT